MDALEAQQSAVSKAGATVGKKKQREKTNPLLELDVLPKEGLVDASVRVPVNVLASRCSVEVEDDEETVLAALQDDERGQSAKTNGQRMKQSDVRC